MKYQCSKIFRNISNVKRYR